MPSLCVRLPFWQLSEQCLAWDIVQEPPAAGICWRPAEDFRAQGDFGQGCRRLEGAQEGGDAEGRVCWYRPGLAKKISWPGGICCFGSVWWCSGTAGSRTAAVTVLSVAESLVLPYHEQGDR